MTTTATQPDRFTAVPLAQTSDEGLLQTFAALTHRMTKATAIRPADLRLERSLRAQRNIVQDEILRRMGCAR